MPTYLEDATSIKGPGGNLLAANYPLPSGADSVYEMDVKHELSDVGTFTGSDLRTLFNNLDNSITDSSATNPKWFKFYLERPIKLNSVGIIAKTGNFSNVKITLLDRQNTVLTTIDNSAVATKYTSHRYLAPQAYNVCCFLVEFYTADPVTISFLYLRKVATVASVIVGTKDNGDQGQALLDNENRLVVSSQPYTYGIAESSISGHTSLLKFGTRSAVAANTSSVIWEGTAALYTYLTSAEQLKVTSTSGSDVAAGTGARTLTIIGLDADWLEYSETVTLTGATPVTTTGSFLRVFRSYVATCGAGYTNAGAITITNNAGTNPLVYIPAGDAQTLMAMWTVPADKVFYMLQGSVSTDTNKGGKVGFWTRLNDGGILYPWLIKYRAYIFQGSYPFIFQVPFRIPPKTDIEVRILTPAAAGTTSCGATFEGWYEDI